MGDRQRTLPTYRTVGFRKRSTADRGGVVQNPPVLREGQEILLGPGIPSKYQHKAEVWYSWAGNRELPQKDHTEIQGSIWLSGEGRSGGKKPKCPGPDSQTGLSLRCWTKGRRTSFHSHHKLKRNKPQWPTGARAWTQRERDPACSVTVLTDLGVKQGQINMDTVPLLDLQTVFKCCCSLVNIL